MESLNRKGELPINLLDTAFSPETGPAGYSLPTSR
jgi:hypothetical protein